MEEILRSIRAFLYERSVSPLAGAFVLAWLVLNYRILFILFSGDHYGDNFAAIDEFFYIDAREESDWLNRWLGRLWFGLVSPALLAIGYIFIYPFLAAPVYQFTLSRRQKLRKIKQEAENQRLLSIEESRELYKRLSQLQQIYDSDTDQSAKQISSLTQTFLLPLVGCSLAKRSNFFALRASSRFRYFPAAIINRLQASSFQTPMNQPLNLHSATLYCRAPNRHRLDTL